MLASERARLLREDPWDATDLAEELYAMFTNDTTPTQLGSAATAQFNPAVGAPYQITNAPSGDIPVLSINRQGQNFTISFNPTTGVLGGEAPTGAAASRAGANVFSGQIAAYLGSNLYRVTIYPLGRSQAGEDVEVTQLEGDPLYPHANGRWAAVWKEADGNYAMNLPTWG